MKWLGKSNQSAIGIDVDGRTIAAMQLTRRERAWHIRAATILERTAGGDGGALKPEEMERLTSVLMRQGFAGRRIVLAVPNDKLLTGVLDAPPPSSGAPIEQIARIELARVHKCEPESLQLGYWELPQRQRHAGGAGTAEARGTANIMVAACPIVEAESLLEAFEADGWNVAGLDVQSLAMVRGCAPLTGADLPAALLNIRWNGAELVLHHQAAVVYQRTLDYGGVAPMHRALMEDADLTPEFADLVLTKSGLADPAAAVGENGAAEVKMQSQLSADARRILSNYFDAIVNEVRTSCTYLAHRFTDATPQRLFLIGPGGAIPGAAEFLSRQLETDVKVVAPADVVACPASLTSLCSAPAGSALMTALGLATWSGPEEDA